MSTEITKLLNAACSAYVEDERAWNPHDRRGRWIVIEPGVGRYLGAAPAHGDESRYEGGCR